MKSWDWNTLCLAFMMSSRSNARTSGVIFQRRKTEHCKQTFEEIAMTMKFASVEWTEGVGQVLQSIPWTDCVSELDEDSYLGSNSGQVHKRAMSFLLF